MYFKKYHCHTQQKAVTKAKYSLAQPNQIAINKCLKSVLVNLLGDSEILFKFKEEFQSLHPDRAATLSKTDLQNTVGRLAVKKIVHKAFQIICRKHAWFLLASIKPVRSISLTKKKDFGKGSHTSYTFMRQLTSIREIPPSL